MGGPQTGVHDQCSTQCSSALHARRCVCSGHNSQRVNLCTDERRSVLQFLSPYQLLWRSHSRNLCVKFGQRTQVLQGIATRIAAQSPLINQVEVDTLMRQRVCDFVSPVLYVPMIDCGRQIWLAHEGLSQVVDAMIWIEACCQYRVWALGGHC